MEGKPLSLSLKLNTVEKPQAFEVVQDFLLVSLRESGKSTIKVIDTISHEVLSKFEGPSGEYNSSTMLTV